MWRSNLSDDEALLPAVRDENFRSAAIAAMGYRLAAAGPRTRQRLLDRRAAPDDATQDHAIPAAAAGSAEEDAPWADGEAEADLFDDADDELIEHPPLARGVIIRRVVVLGIAAACGFGAVLYAQGPEHTRLHPHSAEKLAAKAPPPADAPAATAAPAIPQDLGAQDLAGQQLAPTPAALVQPLPLRNQLVVMTAAAAEPSPPPRARPVATHSLPILLAPPARVTAVVFKRPEPKPHVSHPAPAARPIAAKIELPRWLTGQHSSPPRDVVLSPPPHDLSPPPAAARPAASTPAPSAPAAPVEQAAAAEPAYQRPPLRRPARPAYGAYYYGYGPYYPPPYWNPYAYRGTYAANP